MEKLQRGFCSKRVSLKRGLGEARGLQWQKEWGVGADAIRAQFNATKAPRGVLASALPGVL